MGKEKKKYFASVAVCTAAIIITILVSVFFVAKVEDVATSDRMNHLQQMASHGAAAASNKIQGGVAVLKALSRFVEGSGIDLLEMTSMNGLHSVSLKSDFESLSIVDRNGTVYHTINEIPINISDRYYFSRFLQGELVVSELIDARDDGSDVIVIGAPVRRDGVVIGGFIARYPVDLIDKLLDKSIHDENVRCYVCYSDGQVFSAANIASNEKRMSNILLDIQQGDKRNANAVEKISEDMLSGKTGYAEAKYGGTKFLISYKPVGINDLYCIAMMPHDTPLTNIQHTTDNIIWGGMAILIMLIALLLYSMIIMQKRRMAYERVNHELEGIYTGIPAGIFRCSCDSSMRVSFANDTFYSLIGMTENDFEEICDSHFSSLIEGGSEDIISHIDYDTIFNVEKRMDDGDGGKKWIGISVRVVRKEDGSGAELLCTLNDISLQHRLYDEVHMHEERCELMLEQMQDIIFEWNCDKKEMYYSRYFDEKFGYTPIVSEFPDGFVHLGIVYRDDRQTFLNLFRTIDMGSSYSEDEVRIRKNDGGYIWCRVCIMAVRDENNKLRRIMGVISDIDAKKREDDKEQDSAKRDSLTMLLNKAAAEEMIEKSLSDTGSGRCAFLMIDVDNFTEVNEKLGREAGDEALKNITERIRRLFRDGDIIGRLGGDEFVVFMKNITGERIADYKAKCIVQALDCMITGEDDKNVKISASVGIAFSPEDAKSYIQLYSKADKALYYAKQNGKSQVAVYCDEMTDIKRFEQPKPDDTDSGSDDEKTEKTEE